VLANCAGTFAHPSVARMSIPNPFRVVMLHSSITTVTVSQASEVTWPPVDARHRASAVRRRCSPQPVRRRSAIAVADVRLAPTYEAANHLVGPPVPLLTNLSLCPSEGWPSTNARSDRMSGSIRRVATIVAASLFVGLNIGAVTAQMKLNMPTRTEDPRTEEQKKAEAERKKAIDDAYKKATDSIPEPKGKRDPWKNVR